MIPDEDIKVRPLSDAECLRNGTTYMHILIVQRLLHSG